MVWDIVVDQFQEDMLVGASRRENFIKSFRGKASYCKFVRSQRSHARGKTRLVGVIT